MEYDKHKIITSKGVPLYLASVITVKMGRQMNNQQSPSTDKVSFKPGLCIVCSSAEVRYFITAEGRDYYRCETCRATFLEPSQRLSTEEEHRRYRQHRNHQDDPEYRRFLSKLANPLLQVLGNNIEGLDYGCGSGPALAKILSESGHRINLFDPLFFSDRQALEQNYDVITCTETAEHFHNPAAEFALFDRLLRPGGWLAVMTCFQTTDDAFANWHYRRDPTHVVFYHKETLRYIADNLGWSCRFPAKDVALMQKPPPAKISSID